jgi:23S rRNA pseudouridine2605 synthase
MRGRRRDEAPRPSGGDAVSLPRALSKLGHASRSQAEQLVRAGRVTVNGVVARDVARRVDPGRDRLAVDGVPVRAATRVYVALNKPRGLVTTRVDAQGRATVYTCLDDSALPPLAPVGRLDRASEGLLLFTNDTRWAARLLAPDSHVDKVYHVQVDRVPDTALVAALATGVDDAGERLAAKAARVLRTGTRTGWLEIVLDEGRNRHIRRLLAALDVEVMRLVRVAIGSLALGDLAKGRWRRLGTAEVAALARDAERARRER